MDKERYQNSSRPTEYRESDDLFKCSNCDYSVRSCREGWEWYCQKHQVDVLGKNVCDNYHTSIFDM